MKIITPIILWLNNKSSFFDGKRNFIKLDIFFRAPNKQTIQ